MAGGLEGLLTTRAPAPADAPSSFLGPRPGSRHLLPIVASLLLISITAGSSAAGPAAAEYDIKAAFLYNFALYVSWPDNVPAAAGGTFVIGVLGRDPFMGSLDALAAERTVAGKAITVRRFATPADRVPCHILFVASADPAELEGVVEATRGSGTLVVGDTPGCAARGAAIGFVLRESKIRFQVNPAAARDSGLVLSSKLLRLAEIVEGDDGAP